MSRKCPECGRKFDPGDPRTTSAYSHSDFIEFCASTTRLLIFVTGALAIAAFLLSATAYGFEPFIGPFILYACGVPFAPALLWLVIAAFLPRMQLSRRMRVAAVALPLLFASIAMSHWPLRLNLALHRPILMRLADQVQANGSIQTPGFVGLIPIGRCA